MNHEQIVENVSAALGKYEMIPDNPKDKAMAEVMEVVLEYVIKENLIEPVLEAAGFWELLEAAEDLLKPGGVIPVDDMVVGGEKIKKLEAVIAKITGAGGYDA